jgi:long-chain acyl-CoA synthetase
MLFPRQGTAAREANAMHMPWLEHYDSGVPRTIGTYPEKTLVDFLAERARSTPEARALSFAGTHITWRQVEQASDALAQSLAALGVKPGDRVALLLPNCPQFVIGEMAVWKLGAMIAPQNPIYTERELEESLNTTAPDTVIVLTKFYDTVKACQPRTTVRRVIATNIKEYLPPLLRIGFTLLKEKKEGHRIELAAGDHWLQDLVERGASLGKPSSAAKPDGAAVILMSGGTTGTPKGVLSDHRSLVMSGTQLAAWLQESVAGGGASILLPLPLFHTYGCAGAQTISIVAGVTLILVPNPRDIGDVLKTVDREKPTLMCGVPTLFTAMLSHTLVMQGKIDFSATRACFSGAAALMAETKKRFEALTGGRIVEGYSLTEATMATCANPLRGENKIGSVGMPLPDVRVRVVDSEEGKRELPVKEVGEITINAPQLMRGYWKNPDETAQMLRRGDDGSLWLHTGDLGYIDEDGYVFLVDRKKDLIKVSGYQVWPREIEEVISSHPAVAEVGVAGVPDPKKGDVINAWIVLRPGATATEPELRAYCRERLAPYKVPAKFEIRTELPKTMIGKVLRRVLVAEAKEGEGGPAQ